MPAMPGPGPFIVRAVGLIERFRIVVVLFWMASLTAGVVLGPRLLSATTLEFTAPPHSAAAHAQAILAREFPSQGKIDPIIVVLDRLNGSSVLGADLQAFSEALQSGLPQLPLGHRFLSTPPVQDYYSFAARGLTIMGEKFVKDQWAIIVIQVPRAATEKKRKRKMTAFLFTPFTLSSSL